MLKKAFYLSLGSELLNFKNNLYNPIISKKLSEIGINLNQQITLKDDSTQIEKALNYAIKNSDIIITTGGLGPTFDDLTRKIFSKILKLKIIYSKKIDNYLKNKYKTNNLNPNLKNQCFVLENAVLIKNDNGTAYGELIFKDNKTFIILPGPLREWQPMWDKYIKKILISKFKIKKQFYSQTFKTADLKEVEVENLLKPLLNKYQKVEYTVLGGTGTSDFFFKTEDKNIYLKLKKEIKKILNKNLYSLNKDTLEEVLAQKLTKTNKTISGAESCTSGLISYKLTKISGSSSFFKGGINCYSNESKTNILKVKKETIKKYGAVSKECAKEMAENAMKIFNTDFAFSITGIAGPSGGTKEKPVGRIYFAIKDKKNTYIFERNLKGERNFIRESASNIVLFHLLKIVQ